MNPEYGNVRCDIAFYGIPVLGSDKTWHGELDLFSLGVGVTATTDIEESSGTSDTCDSSDQNADVSRVDIAGGGDDSGPHSVADNEEAGSQGERTNMEFKLDVKQKNIGGMKQVISQAVVFGWTEHNRHRNLSPYIPSVYIDNHGFCILVYNPVKDSLILAIHAVRFIDEALGIRNSLDVYSGIFALWIVFNHRLFFKKDIEHNVESGFKSQVAVHHYEKLTAFQSHIRNSFEVSPICFESCVTFGDKKRKRSSAE